jgi:hypothetical protein
MDTLTHQGPGYRSRLISKAEAAELARRLRQDPQFCEVRLLESTRSQKHHRFYVDCLPNSPEKREELLDRHQAERHKRAEQEGPHLVWLADPEQPLWHVLSLSGEVYQVGNKGEYCSCRDGGVCPDNGISCKHAVALQLGLGVFVTPELRAKLHQLEVRLSQPPAPRHPVAVPVSD